MPGCPVTIFFDPQAHIHARKPDIGHAAYQSLFGVNSGCQTFSHLDLHPKLFYHSRELWRTRRCTCGIRGRWVTQPRDHQRISYHTTLLSVFEAALSPNCHRVGRSPSRAHVHTVSPRKFRNPAQGRNRFVALGPPRALCIARAQMPVPERRKTAWPSCPRARELEEATYSTKHVLPLLYVFWRKGFAKAAQSPWEANPGNLSVRSRLQATASYCKRIALCVNPSAAVRTRGGWQHRILNFTFSQFKFSLINSTVSISPL